MLVTLFLPSPYVIDEPGPGFDTLGTVQNSSDEDVDVISIDGAQTYPTTGSLTMLTVSQWGTPSGEPSWLQVVGAWLDPAKTVIPIDEVYPPGTSEEDTAEENAQAMASSQQDAIAAALSHLGYTVGTTIVVSSVLSGSNAEGVLQVGDRITQVNGQAVSTAADVLAIAATASEESPLSVTYVRDGATNTVSIAPITSDSGQKQIGIGVTYVYTFPFDVTITLDNVGGPSAGMMFALGIIDKLTEGSLTGGYSIAGTGTIDESGTVGAIGGIRQKMVTAERAGAQFFLAPASNCDEVVGHVPSGLSVVSVSTLDDALDALQTISSMGSTEGLPTCTADSASSSG